jgi:hypothetical protein
VRRRSSFGGGNRKKITVEVDSKEQAVSTGHIESGLWCKGIMVSKYVGE